MCIRNRLNAEQRIALLKNKPDIIKVWKILSPCGRSCFSSFNSAKLSTKMTHLRYLWRFTSARVG